MTDKQIEEFRVLFYKEYGQKLSKEEARESAENLVRFIEVVLPIAKRIRDKKGTE